MLLSIGPTPTNEATGGKRGVKRAADSDDESSYQPPVHDLYRSRQQKRLQPVAWLLKFF